MVGDVDIRDETAIAQKYFQLMLVVVAEATTGAAKINAARVEIGWGWYGKAATRAVGSVYGWSRRVRDSSS
jgi:hypothetical protein